MKYFWKNNDWKNEENLLLGIIHLLINIVICLCNKKKLEKKLEYTVKDFDSPGLLNNFLFNKNKISSFDYYIFVNFKHYCQLHKQHNIYSINQFKNTSDISNCNELENQILRKNYLYTINKKNLRKILSEEEVNYINLKNWTSFNKNIRNLKNRKYYRVVISVKKLNKDKYVVLLSCHIKNYIKLANSIKLNRKDFINNYTRGSIDIYIEIYNLKINQKIFEDLKEEFFINNIIYEINIINNYEKYYQLKKNSNTFGKNILLYYNIYSKIQLNPKKVVAVLDRYNFKNNYAIFTFYVSVHEDSEIYFDYHEYLNEKQTGNLFSSNTWISYTSTDITFPLLMNTLERTKEERIINEVNIKNLFEIDLLMRCFGKEEYNLNEIYLEYYQRNNNKLMLIISIITLILSIVAIIISMIN